MRKAFLFFVLFVLPQVIAPCKGDWV